MVVMRAIAINACRRFHSRIDTNVMCYETVATDTAMNEDIIVRCPRFFIPLYIILRGVKGRLLWRWSSTHNKTKITADVELLLL